ncbi:MAG: FAD-dependent 5-carboxymethylaminomethyl-2-thiouridine(34) oxidoreductase MnmC [Proteobacteria bacterium]|uniref:FAD-dependent 5-carboxymethylaminomethyl-2-thiouridine(34) oxidoreductase MnmC n=1 Tax=Aquabacterium sp. TaxID=1872578 RepID=UPI0035C74C6E|nr:FAD-dependent 5-carboxymethylaminomethyl-2-thiouridine(34) oxidoreductase MnmC [Pseudomonadota bacterium]
MTRSPARPSAPAAPASAQEAAPCAPDCDADGHPGNGLPARWQGRSDFVILATGFGQGNHCLATWAAWREDPQRCDRLTIIAIETHPLRPAALARVHGLETPAPGTDRQALARRLLAAWPPLTPGWHHLTLEQLAGPQGQRQEVRLMLGLGDTADLLPSLVAAVDAFCLDGFQPPSNPERWVPALLSRLNRLASAGATAATWSAEPWLRDALQAAQFEVREAPGHGSKCHATTATFSPRFVPPPAPGGLWPAAAAERRQALVIGGGLAGCSAAWSLVRQGWQVQLLDAASGPAQGASGNPGGLFHSIVHAEDGVHARAHRAAALATWARVRDALAHGTLPGQAEGLLRLEGRMDADAAHALLQRHPWLGEQVRWLTQGEAQALAGLPVPSGGWLFLQGGWLQPGAYARWLLAQAESAHVGARPLLHQRWSCPVARIRHDATQGLWQALDAQGEVLAQAPSLVLANAWQAQALLDTLPESQAVAPLPLSAVRGQITVLPAAAPGAASGQKLPRIPVAGSGYVLTLGDGRLLCGATTQHHDGDPALRPADHRHNLAQAHRLGALPTAPAEAAAPDAPPSPGEALALEGRVGWRATTPDRLPLVGALPWHPERLATGGHRRLEQVRRVPRERQAQDGLTQGGLYVLSGLGSRGITWAALAGELLAHWVTGSPCPVEAELRDAMDPARFLARQHRH